MEVKFTPVNHAAFLRSIGAFEQPTMPLKVSTGHVQSLPPTGSAGLTPSNTINWSNVLAGTIVVASILLIIHYFSQEENRKD
jgi:ABC-type glycerol-3-phosphate transport system permease component